jgi:hypothetical protein
VRRLPRSRAGFVDRLLTEEVTSKTARNVTMRTSLAASRS